jgi:1-acyl-sn-glycerol-3-phosphate acyltransferase
MAKVDTLTKSPMYQVLSNTARGIAAGYTPRVYGESKLDKLRGGWVGCYYPHAPRLIDAWEPFLVNAHVQWFRDEPRPMVFAAKPSIANLFAKVNLPHITAVRQKDLADSTERGNLNRQQFFQAGVDILQAGGMVMGYPEGTRTSAHGGGKLNQGLFILAQTARVPVVPIRVETEFDPWELGRLMSEGKPEVRIAFGEPTIIPFDSERTEGNKAARTMVMQAFMDYYTQSWEQIAERETLNYF